MSKSQFRFTFSSCTHKPNLSPRLRSKKSSLLSMVSGKFKTDLTVVCQSRFDVRRVIEGGDWKLWGKARPRVGEGVVRAIFVDSWQYSSVRSLYFFSRPRSFRATDLPTIRGHAFLSNSQSDLPKVHDLVKAKTHVTSLGDMSEERWHNPLTSSVFSEQCSVQNFTDNEEEKILVTKYNTDELRFGL